MSVVTHYEVLGVRSDASADEIRRAYLVLARAHHPDFHAAAGAGKVASAEAEMRRINLAWQVLGDRQDRAAYDRSIGLRTDAGAAPVAANIQQPSTEFRPYFEVDEDDDDSWRYEPDEGDPSTVPPRALLMAPPALGALGLALLAFSLPAQLAPLSAVGLVCLGLSVVLFIFTPVVAMFRSQSAEERARRRR
jgi:curved DNA-binding protein CbpA